MDEACERPDPPRPVDAEALAALFACHRDRLRGMVRLRLDRRLLGRLDPSDVLREASLEVDRRAAEYLANPEMPPFLWLRLVTAQRLTAVHRRHLSTPPRDAGPEVSLHRGALPRVASVTIAYRLLGRLTTASRAATRAELQTLLQAVLNGMDPVDREILVLRHFEELSNAEAAQVLGLRKSVVSTRYVEALRRLRGLMGSNPGGFGV